MAQLIVRKLEASLVKLLRVRAARNGRSAEEEHREILREALRPSKSFKQLLREIPDVGEDEDFARHDDLSRDSSW